MAQPNWTTHKDNRTRESPKVSIILLDWSCRERFTSLDWLNDQTVPRNSYELIWVELYHRVIPEALEKSDVVITCDQKGLYHKHIGYNVGLLAAQGTVITVCDSDAVFARDFIASLVDSFQLHDGQSPVSKVLMHYEWRTKHTYPDDLKSIQQLPDYSWLKLWPNVGACMSVLRHDAIRFGGFDEEPSYRGYMCGPYDLGWRLVNAGIPEEWHDPSIALWHFAHDNPLANFGALFSFKLWRESVTPHILGHSLAAVEAFSTGRLLPKLENPLIFQLRMGARRIGSTLEKEYSNRCGPHGFGWLERSRYFFDHHRDALRAVKTRVIRAVFQRPERVRRDILLSYRRLQQEGYQRIAFIADSTGFVEATNFIRKEWPAGNGPGVVEWGADLSGYDVVVPISRFTLDELWQKCADIGLDVNVRRPAGFHIEFLEIASVETNFRRLFLEANKRGLSRIGLYPGGGVSRKGWQVLKENLHCVECFIDDQAASGEQLLQKPILPPPCWERVDLVVITSQYHEESLWKRTESARLCGVQTWRLSKLTEDMRSGFNSRSSHVSAKVGNESL